MQYREIRRKIKRFRRYLIYYALLGGYSALNVLPYQAIRILGHIGAHLAFALLRRERELALHNLHLAFPQKSSSFKKRVARGVFLNLARQSAALIACYRKSSEPCADHIPISVNWRRVGEITLAAGSITVTGHVGAWELMGCAFGQYWPGRLAVFARRIYFDAYNKWIIRIRSAFNVRIFYLEDSPTEAIRYVRNKNVLGILPDQDKGRIDGIFVPFFGRQAWTPIGPATLALAARVPIVCVFLVWDGKSYRIVVEGPFPLPNTGSREKDVRILTESWTKALEEVITKYPDQWVWFHKRWKTRPQEVEKLPTRPGYRRKKKRSARTKGDGAT